MTEGLLYIYFALVMFGLLYLTAWGLLKFWDWCWRRYWERDNRRRVGQWWDSRWRVHKC